MSLKETWNTALNQLKDSVSPGEFSSWFSRLSLGEEKDGKLVLYVPSSFVRDRFENQYRSLVENALAFCGMKATVDFVVKKAEIEKPSQKTEAKPAQKAEAKPIANSTLNPAYTFASFVPGENSNFAYNACLAISKNPGSAYNPCLIYGGVGLGKTHLLQSIGNAICTDNPKAKVLYITAENIINEFVQSFVNDTTKLQFKNKYRKTSVLLIDDIQILQGKSGIQEELFNTFNDLYDTGRQIVFTCDRPVEELTGFTDRLKSRFARGLNIDIQPPSYEIRIAILKKKCEEKNFNITDEIIEYIAANISSNVRVLESCITKLIAYSTLLGKEISLEIAKEQLKQIISSNIDSSGIMIDTIIKTVASYFNVSAYDIKGKNKNQSIVLPRQIAMYLSSKLTDYSTTEIALEFGGKNHTTVMYNVGKIEAMIRADEKDISSVITKLTNQIKLSAKK